ADWRGRWLDWCSCKILYSWPKVFCSRAWLLHRSRRRRSLTCRPGLVKNVLKFGIPVDLRLCKGTERNDREAFAPRIIDGLSHHSFADPAPAQGLGHFGMIDDDERFAGA